MARHRKPKRGVLFEKAVAEVVKAIDPSATVRQGQWVDGPDGRRDQDVSITGTVNGIAHSAIIECKDYNLEKTGPVGIAVVDALESKRRDLNVSIAIICSNAGFTADATRKASRVGIVLIGVFRQADGRISHQLIETVYFRRLRIEHLGFRLEHVENGAKRVCADASPTFQGSPVANWICHRALDLIMFNPIAAGHYAETLEFKQPVHFSLTGGMAFVATHVFSEFILSGSWFEQSAAIDGTAGVYNFLRRRVWVGMGPCEVHIKGMDLTKGTPIAFPPRPEIDVSAGLVPGEVWLQLLYL